MIRIYRRIGDDSRMLDRITTSDPVEAEEHYLTLVQYRTPGPGVVRVHPARGLDLVVPTAHYRTDRDWPEGICREQEQERAKLQWGSGPPSPWMARAVSRLLMLTGAECAALIGVDSRTWRRWTAAEDSPSRRPMPLAAYHTLLVRAGAHPDYGPLAEKERMKRVRLWGERREGRRSA